MSEPDIIVHHREQLAELLTEAVEIEHNLMCCYLFAAWSLKQGEAEGLTSTQADAVKRWRRLITHVAIDEMTHFANANNILAALGGRPRLGRPNFPVSRGYHPADVLVSLHPFNKSTIDHFVFLERPEGVELEDGTEFEHALDYVRATTAKAMMPSVQDYATVGHLYRGIREGIIALSESCGEESLFIGDPELQISPSIVSLKGLVAVTDLASALLAVDHIVEQGEGNTDNPEDSHYRKFCEVRDELARLSELDPDFEPARPVAYNPVQRKPPAPQGKVHVAEPDAAAVLDLSNAMYNHMLRTLGAIYEPIHARTRQGLIDEAIGLMFQLVPLNEVLTRLPANKAHEGITAGMSFAVTREIRVPQASSVVQVLSGRLEALAVGASALGHIDEVLNEVARELSGMAARIATLPPTTQPSAHSPRDAREATLDSAPSKEGEPPGGDDGLEHSSDPTIPPRRVVDGVEIIEGEALRLYFDTKRCIHARFCVLGAPDVFVGNVKGPWIRPDAMDVEALVAVAHRCPSGAITYDRKTPRPEEHAPPVNTVHLREHGPLTVAADIQVEGDVQRFRAVLCRCGASKRKPFCDGSHTEIDFRATGEPAESEQMTALEARDGVLHIKPMPDGPLNIHGNVEICSGTGHTIAKVTRTALCRCGASKNKPFCDGSHRDIHFKTRETSELT